eukprot:COSAG01_NODE_56305_length_319_cov_0.868182_1_plen_57_part_10
MAPGTGAWHVCEHKRGCVHFIRVARENVRPLSSSFLPKGMATMPAPAKAEWVKRTET